MSYDADCYCDDLEDDDGPECVFCEMETGARLRALWKNLATAGVLCRAYALGYLACRTYDAGEDEWSPGCGRSA